jgi:intein/homing endonuclease
LPEKILGKKSFGDNSSSGVKNKRFNMKFDVSHIPLSSIDIKKKIILPKSLSKELAELIGIIIGDGYLHNNKHKYVIGIVGNPKIDREYFNYIQNLILVNFNLQTNIKHIGRGLRLTFNSKCIFCFFVHLGMQFGLGKGQRVTIPENIIRNKIFWNSVLRGIFDTDGTIFTSAKKGSPKYPCIELTTTSKLLALQVYLLLVKLGFKVASIREYKYKHSKLISYKVSLYGLKNTKLWSKIIGFSNQNKYKKMIEILKENNL